MVDDPKPDTPQPEPAKDTPVTPEPPKDDKKDIDPLKVGEELGKYKKTAEEYNVYRKQVDPILETIASDPELIEQIKKVHDKRTGVPEEKKDDKPMVGVQDRDTRTAIMNSVTSEFEKDVGIDKLTLEEQKEIRGLMGSTMKMLLDQNDNKTISQVYDEVPLSKYKWYLQRAHKLVAKVGQKVEDEKDTGVIGGMPSSSISSSQITLTDKEKVVAKMQGVSEADYLTMKKEINDRRNSDD